MAKKQTFSDKTERVKAAGAAHCKVCDDIPVSTKVREFVNEDGRMKLVTKTVKICKCNTAEIYG